MSRYKLVSSALEYTKTQDIYDKKTGAWIGTKKILDVGDVVWKLYRSEDTGLIFKNVEWFIIKSFGDKDEAVKALNKLNSFVEVTIY